MVVSQKILGPTPKSQSPKRKHLYSWWKLLSFDFRSHTGDGSEIPKNNHLGPGMFFKPFIKNGRFAISTGEFAWFFEPSTRFLETHTPQGWMVPAKIASEMKVGANIGCRWFFSGDFWGGSCGVSRWWQLKHFFPKQCGSTWGSYGSGKKPGWLDRGGGRGSVHNSSLFSWFRACMFVSSVNFRSFGVAATDGSGFCL